MSNLETWPEKIYLEPEDQEPIDVFSNYGCGDIGLNLYEKKRQHSIAYIRADLLDELKLENLQPQSQLLRR